MFTLWESFEIRPKSYSLYIHTEPFAKKCAKKMLNMEIVFLSFTFNLIYVDVLEKFSAERSLILQAVFHSHGRVQKT